MSGHHDADGTAGDQPAMADAAAEQDAAGWREQQRRRLRALRNAVNPADRPDSDAAIGAGLTKLLQTRDARCIGVYWPLPGEPDLRDWYETLVRAGKSLALPDVAARAQPLKFRRWQPGQPLGSDALGIPCPQGTDEVLPDTVLAPCVGFDPHGFRLGNGGGYYDRTLAVMPARPFMIGVAYHCLLLHSIRPQAHDVPMDVVVTEKAVFPGTRAAGS